MASENYFASLREVIDSKWWQRRDRTADAGLFHGWQRHRELTLDLNN